METASIVASFVSLILAGVAIWMSIHFYTQSKNSEANVQIALEGIKAQTAALQALNARTLDRLTKYVTTPRDESAQAVELVYGTIRQITAIIPGLKPPDANLGVEATRTELAMTYVVLWHYTAKANVWASMMLPPADKFDNTNRFDQLVRHVLDSSNTDFEQIGNLVAAIDPALIERTNWRS